MDVIQANLAAEKGSGRHPWEFIRLNVLANLIEKHAGTRLDGNSTVLDVGCGDAFVASWLAERFASIDCMGVDPALTPELANADYVRAHEDRVRLCTSLDEIEPPRNPIRMVTILDVLEHIEDDYGMLQSLLDNEKLAPDALFIVFVPAFEPLYCSHDRLLSHYRRYSKRQICRLLERGGLDIVDSGYFLTSFLPIRVIETALERLKIVPEKDLAYSATWNGGPRFSKFVVDFMTTEFAITSQLRRLGLSLPGLSTFAVAKRPSSDAGGNTNPTSVPVNES